MELRDLINRLEKEDPEDTIKLGFHNPHSYRGYYEQLAFEPKYEAKIGEMLKCAKSALGSTYPGWKGGEFTMEADTNCNLSVEGKSNMWNDSISPLLLDYMLKDKL